MILAAPLVIPFAKAVGLSVGTLGMAALADKVNDYIEANPEESMKILSTIIPSVGIGQIFMSKEDKISLEDLEDMTDEEAQDLSKEEKAELMKQAGKRRNRELSIATSEKIGLSGPGKEKQDIEYEIDKRYDEGGVEQKKAPFDYTKFFRKRRADGGAIGIEVLFEEKKPRKDFNLGGLTGPAKNIYDTMMAAGYFTEDEIRNAIINAGYEIPGTTTTTTPVTNVAPNIINQGGGGDGPPPPGPKGGLGLSRFDYGYTSPGGKFNMDDIGEGTIADEDYTFGMRLGDLGTGIKGGLAKAFQDLRKLPTPFNIASRAIGNISDFFKQKAEEKAKQELAAQLAAAQREIDRMGYQDYGSGGGLDPSLNDPVTGEYTGASTQDYGSGEKDGGIIGYKKGGLATMFVEKK